MKPSEAIDYLLDPIGKREMHDDAVWLAVDALKKQEPVKIYKKWDWYNGKNKPCCVGCHGYIREYDRYCSGCGQAIDWSKND